MAALTRMQRESTLSHWPVVNAGGGAGMVAKPRWKGGGNNLSKRVIRVRGLQQRRISMSHV